MGVMARWFRGLRGSNISARGFKALRRLDYTRARDLFQQEVTLWNDEEWEKSVAFNDLGIVDFFEHQYFEAAKNYSHSVRLASQSKTRMAIDVMAGGFSSLANVYEEFGDLKGAEQFAEKALAFTSICNDELSKIRKSNRLLSLAMRRLALGNTESAEKLAIEARDLAKSLKNQDDLCCAWRTIAEIQIIRNDAINAEASCRTALKTRSNPNEHAMTLLVQAKAYAQLGRWREAEKILGGLLKDLEQDRTALSMKIMAIYDFAASVAGHLGLVADAQTRSERAAVMRSQIESNQRPNLPDPSELLNLPIPNRPPRRWGHNI